VLPGKVEAPPDRGNLSVLLLKDRQHRDVTRHGCSVEEGEAQVGVIVVPKGLW